MKNLRPLLNKCDIQDSACARIALQSTLDDEQWNCLRLLSVETTEKPTDASCEFCYLLFTFSNDDEYPFRVYDYTEANDLEQLLELFQDLIYKEPLVERQIIRFEIDSKLAFAACFDADAKKAYDDAIREAYCKGKCVTAMRYRPLW